MQVILTNFNSFVDILHKETPIKENSMLDKLTDSLYAAKYWR